MKGSGCDLRFPGSGLTVGEYGTVEARQHLLEEGPDDLVEEHSLRRFGAEYISSWNRVSVRVAAFFAKVVRLGGRWRESGGAGGREERGGVGESDGMTSNWIRFRDESLLCFGGEEFPTAQEGECTARARREREADRLRRTT